ncbi:5-(carboxyamino)imidazole ribonucleotide mutase [bacterium]|nr:5-(carboxyamino)imidazole ribonucleotide mutase [candidate division CSSED10-310 bacterium]
MRSCPRVLIIVGSVSDKDVIESAITTLKQFKIPFEVKVSSAHRTPERTTKFARQAESRGIRVIIAAAGWSAGLPGAIAAETVLPVIGIPVPSSILLGMDAMLSMVQMPPGVPVATVAVGKGGAKNAALLAIQILANEFNELKEPLKSFKTAMAREVITAAADLDSTWEP